MRGSKGHRVVANWPTAAGQTPSIEGERLLWGLVVLVMVLDVATTAVGLQVGLNEGNAVVLAALDAFGLLGLLALKAVVVGAAALAASLIPDAMSPVIPLGLVIPTTIAVATNLALLGIA